MPPLKPSLARAYINTGTYAAPTWTELKTIQDATTETEIDELDATPRNAAFAATVDGPAKLTFNLTLLWDPADPGLAALQNHYINRTPLDFLATDQPVTISGAQGPRAYVHVFHYRKLEQRNNAQAIEVTLKPTYADQPPTWWQTP
jgi:hypothetical protein